MRKIIILILMFGIQQGFCQFSMTSYTSKYYKAFLKSKTLIVLTGDEDIDSHIKSTILEKWTITPYEFIDVDQISHYEKGKFEERSKYSILVLQTIISFVKTRLLGLYVPANIDATSGNNYLAVIPVTCESLEKPRADDECFYQNFIYKFDLMINQINQVVNWTKEMEYKSGGRAHFYNAIDFSWYLNEKAGKEVKIQKPKTLLLSSNLFYGAKYSKYDFERDYGYEIEVVGRQDYIKIISEKREGLGFKQRFQLPLFAYMILV